MKSRLLTVASVCLLVTSPVIRAVPLATSYTIDILGLTDAEHTRDDGYRVSVANRLNEASQASGFAHRYNGTGTDMGRSAWFYNGTNTFNIGLTDVEHTRSDGYRNSYERFLNEAGQVGGVAYRYNGTGTRLGSSAWLYNGTSTVNIGLTDTEHTRSSDGYRNSLVNDFNETGQAAGYAQRFSGTGTDMGRSAWFYNGTNTFNIGLTDTEHTRIDGYRDSTSYVSHLNEAGQALGVAERYNGSVDTRGWSVWLYNGTSTVNIGLTDAEHTSSVGYRISETDVGFFNEAGQAIGDAYRYNGTGTDMGRSAWLYNGTTTVNVGLTDAEHTRSDGYRYSSTVYVGSLNGAGQVVGNAYRYNGSNTDMGRSAWFYNGTTSVNIGLTDAEHTRSSDEYRFSAGGGLNEAGQVTGIAQRFSSTGTDLGYSAWLYNGTSTANIGLTDTEHTRGDGYRYSRADHLNELGHAAGFATRNNSTGTPLGQDAWLYNGTSTVIIGLTGNEYTRNDGYQYNIAEHLNETGQVAGLATRYNGTDTYMGKSAWLYDLTLDQTFSLNLSIRSDGYAYSEVRHLGDDGLALGYYNFYDTGDDFLGLRAFAFTVDDGVIDLGGLVDGGLNAAGWDTLASAYNANELGQILGYGILSDMPRGEIGYLLTAVPIPAAVWLFGSGLLGMIGIARRKKVA